jgi:methyl-accepting chemotaxis protein
MSEGVAQLKQHVHAGELAVFKSLDAMMALQGRVFAEREHAAQALYRRRAAHHARAVPAVRGAGGGGSGVVTRSVLRPLGGEPDEAARVLSQIAQRRPDHRSANG